jgi:hypothetical protein
MNKIYSNLSGYDSTTAIGKFNNRDAENAVGFEMRMTNAEYSALSQFIDKVYKDGLERGRQEIAAAVRASLPTSPSEKP